MHGEAGEHCSLHHCTWGSRSGTALLVLCQERVAVAGDQSARPEPAAQSAAEQSGRGSALSLFVRARSSSPDTALSAVLCCPTAAASQHSTAGGDTASRAFFQFLGEKRGG